MGVLQKSVIMGGIWLFSCSVAVCRDKEMDLGSFSLSQAFIHAYHTNPQILKERAVLEQTDEGVSQAVSGWRPSISVGSNANYNQSNYVTYPYGGSFRYSQKFAAPGYSVGVNISQPLFMGGKTVFATRKALDTVRRERAHLIQVENQLFSSVLSAYVELLKAEKLLILARNNEQSIKDQVQLTTRQLQLNQVTRTDFLQASSQYEAARASTRQAEGDCAVARNTFLRVVGIPAPKRLVTPTAFILPVKTEQEVVALAEIRQPQVVGARHALAVQKDAVRVAYAALMPQISAQAAYQHQINQSNAKFTEDSEMVTLQATIPLYQGGAEYSAIRAARHAVDAAQQELNDQKRNAIQQAASIWRQLEADKEQLLQNKLAVNFGQDALKAIRSQEILGVRTTFEVLQQQRLLFDQERALIQNRANLIEHSYSLAAALGILTARNLSLETSFYDAHKHLHQVKWKMFGIK